MDRNYIQNNDIIRRYVANELTDSELAEFEVYYLENSDILDEIEIERSFRRGLRAEQETLQIKNVDRGDSGSFFGSLFSRPLPVAALAAALLVSLVGNVLQFNAKTEVTFDAMRPIDRTYITTLTRSSNFPSIELMRTDAEVIFEIGPIERSNVTIRLTSSDGMEVANFIVSPDTEGYASITLSPTALEQGEYLLLIDEAGENVQRTIIVQ